MAKLNCMLCTAPRSSETYNNRPALIEHIALDHFHVRLYECQACKQGFYNPGFAAFHGTNPNKHPGFIVACLSTKYNIERYRALERAIGECFSHEPVEKKAEYVNAEVQTNVVHRAHMSDNGGRVTTSDWRSKNSDSSRRSKRSRRDRSGSTVSSRKAKEFRREFKAKKRIPLESNHIDNCTDPRVFGSIVFSGQCGCLTDKDKQTSSDRKCPNYTFRRMKNMKYKAEQKLKKSPLLFLKDEAHPDPYAKFSGIQNLEDSGVQSDESSLMITFDAEKLVSPDSSTDSGNCSAFSPVNNVSPLNQLLMHPPHQCAPSFALMQMPTPVSSDHNQKNPFAQGNAIFMNHPNIYAAYYSMVQKRESSPN